MLRYQADLVPRMLYAFRQTRSVNLQKWTAVLSGVTPKGAVKPACAGMTKRDGNKRLIPLLIKQGQDL